MSILAPPDAEIWQGDVFAEVPWTIVRSADFVRPKGAALFERIDPPNSGHRAQLVTASGLCFAALLSHECVVDKRANTSFTFARVLPITTFRNPLQQDVIKSGANYQTFIYPLFKMSCQNPMSISAW